MKKIKQYRTHEDNEHVNPFKDYGDAQVIHRLFSWPRKHLLPHLKNNTSRKGYLKFSAFWGIYSMLIFSIQWSTTCMIRRGHGAAYAGLIVTWIAFWGMTALNRPFTVEELSMIGSETWNVITALFSTEVDIDFKKVMHLIFNPKSIAFFIYSLAFLVVAHIKVISSWFGKGTDEEPRFTGSNIFYLALRKYAPVSDRYMKIVVEPAFWSIVGILFLAYQQWVPAGWYFMASIILAVTESAISINRKAFSL